MLILTSDLATFWILTLLVLILLDSRFLDGSLFTFRNVNICLEDWMFPIVLIYFDRVEDCFLLLIYVLAIFVHAKNMIKVERLKKNIVNPFCSGQRNCCNSILWSFVTQINLDLVQSLTLYFMDCHSVSKVHWELFAPLFAVL